MHIKKVNISFFFKCTLTKLICKWYEIHAHAVLIDSNRNICAKEVLKKNGKHRKVYQQLFYYYKFQLCHRFPWSISQKLFLKFNVDESQKQRQYYLHVGTIRLYNDEILE